MALIDDEMKLRGYFSQYKVYRYISSFCIKGPSKVFSGTKPTIKP